MTEHVLWTLPLLDQCSRHPSQLQIIVIDQYSLSVHYNHSLPCFSLCTLHTASIAQWLRHPPREWKIQNLIPTSAVGIFPG